MTQVRGSCLRYVNKSLGYYVSIYCQHITTAIELSFAVTDFDMEGMGNMERLAITVVPDRGP